MSSGSQAVPSRPTCRSSNRRAFTWRSISRRRHCSVFLCRTCSSLGPTRCANEASCVHHAARRRGGGVAVCGACAAGPAAGGRGIAAYSEGRRSVRQTIPIVGMADDMVGSGLAASMARPGGNTTGVSILSPELDVKRLEILHEFAPQARRIAVLADPSVNPNQAQLASAARELGVQLVVFEVQNPADIGGTLDAIAAASVEAVIVLASPQLNAARHVIIDRTRIARLPTIYQFPETAAEGGLLSYGPRVLLVYRHVVTLVDKILRGAKPADLPIEQPTKFELV